MLRSFLAVELPGTIRKKIGEVQKDLKSSGADVRWVSPENIHLTLKFFGNVEESLIENIVKSIEGPVQDTPSFFLKVQGMGAFPNLKNPRVVWMGLQEGRERVIYIQQQLERVFEKMGFQPEDRPFHPHLTLGRVKSNRGKNELVRGMEGYREEELGNFQVEKIILFKSDLKPMGPIYTTLREIRLGEG